jgi:hypothetical protein
MTQSSNPEEARMAQLLENICQEARRSAHDHIPSLREIAADIDWALERIPAATDEMKEAWRTTLAGYQWIEEPTHLRLGRHTRYIRVHPPPGTLGRGGLLLSTRSRADDEVQMTLQGIGRRFYKMNSDHHLLFQRMGDEELLVATYREAGL